MGNLYPAWAKAVLMCGWTVEEANRYTAVQAADRDTKTIAIRSLLNLSVGESTDLYERMYKHISDLAWRSPASFMDLWDRAWEYARWEMAIGQWDELAWRSYVDKFLTSE